MSFGPRLKELRKGRKLTQEALGTKVNLSKANICKYESGSLEPNFDTLRQFSDTFQVSTDYLLGITENPLLDPNTESPLPSNVYPVTTKTYEVLGSISCGEPVLAGGGEEMCTLTMIAGAEMHADFCLRAKGDSMIGARIFDGDIVFIRKQETVENGEIAAVIIEDEATLKRVCYDEEHAEISLFPENPKYKTMRYKGIELEHIRILGKAIGFQSSL